MKVDCHIESEIAVITIHNPPLNTLDGTVMDEIRTCFNQLKKNETVRAVLVTGKGPSFVAGADIKEFSSWTLDEVEDLTDKGQRIFMQIEKFPAPVIAVINGFALGGGLELALACDLRIASEVAKLGLPEVKLGIIPGYGGTQRLCRTIPVGQAKKMIYTGAIIGAPEAREVGLVETVVAPDELMSVAWDIARKIAANAPMAVRGAKRSINTGRNLSIEQGMVVELGVARMCFGTEDRNEGVDAFINKRKPRFQGK